MKTHLQHKFLSAREACLPMENLNTVAHSRTDSARKWNRKEVLENYNKTSINIGHQHDSWVELMEALRVQTHAEV